MSPDIHIEYTNPPTGQTVTRFDHCPCFDGRQSLLAIDPICWFCKFAAFDLFSDKLPEYGVCKYPQKQCHRKLGNARASVIDLDREKEKLGKTGANMSDVITAGEGAEKLSCKEKGQWTEEHTAKFKGKCVGYVDKWRI